ncbi:MAG: preprotein translocase subunit YajC [Chloroflexota bacterium]
MPLNWSALSTYGLPMLLLLAFWWLFLIKPQQDQEKKRRKMLAELKKGDKVITAGGLVGTVADIKKDTIVLRIAEKAEVQFLRSAITDLFREKDKD